MVESERQLENLVTLTQRRTIWGEGAKETTEKSYLEDSFAFGDSEP